MSQIIIDNAQKLFCKKKIPRQIIQGVSLKKFPHISFLSGFNQSFENTHEQLDLTTLRLVPFFQYVDRNIWGRKTKPGGKYTNLNF